MESKLVSVCIPTYNGEKYLQMAFDSVKTQTYKNIEVVISDDQSEDRTLKICEQFKLNADFPVHIYSHRPSGIGANWNNAIQRSNGEYFKLLFQDDLLKPNAVECMMHHLIINKLEIVVSKRDIINERGQLISTGNWYDKYFDLQKLADIAVDKFYILSKKKLKKLDFKVYSRENFIGEPCATLFTKKLFNNVGLFNNELKQALDYEYLLRVLAKYKIGIIEEKLIQFRYHANQTSQINSNNCVDESKAIETILFSKLLFNINRMEAKRYLFKKYPILTKLNNFRYKLFQ